MPRWSDGTRDRLVEAAFALFGEHGFAATTIDQIAAHAGVTGRTFFRHFRDKEEVLFAEDDALLPQLLTAIAEPEGPQQADRLMEHALTRLAEVMEPTRPMLRQRQALIEAEVPLLGRELAKQARWQQEVAGALRQRGFERGDAELLAAIGFALFRSSLRAWLDESDGTPLADHLRQALPRARTALQQVSAH
jgi:AcrR family transcriptional regulator